MTEPLRKPSQRRTTLAAIVAAGALGLASCGTGASTDPDSAATNSAASNSTDGSAAAETSGSGDATTSGTETLTATTLGTGIAATSADAGVTPLGTADTTMKTLRPEAPSQLMVTAVRVGSHTGFDRIVFDLAGEGEPGWFIDYTTSPAQQGSGNPVEFEGTIALNVNIDGTTYPFELGREDPNIGTVDGVGNITEVTSAGTFEGRSQFVVGMKDDLPYSVQVLQDPHRLVIDIPQG